MVIRFLLLCVVLFSVCEAKTLHFDPQNAHVAYSIVDKTTGTLKTPKVKVALKSLCKAEIHLLFSPPNTLEIAFPNIECSVTLGKGEYRQNFSIQANVNHPTQDFDDRFEALVHDLCRQKLVFQIEPTGKVIETTGNLALLQEAIREGKHSIANTLALNPINQFFNQLHHLAGKKLAAKKYHLSVTNFFPGFRSSKQSSNQSSHKKTFSYTVQKPKGKTIVAKILGSQTLSRKKASDTVSVKGTVHWDANNAYLQERNISIDQISKIKKSSVRLHIKESWKSTNIEIPT